MKNIGAVSFLFCIFFTVCKEHKDGQAYENEKWLWYSYMQMT